MCMTLINSWFEHAREWMRHHGRGLFQNPLPFFMLLPKCQALRVECQALRVECQALRPGARLSHSLAVYLMNGRRLHVIYEERR